MSAASKRRPAAAASDTRRAPGRRILALVALAAAGVVVAIGVQRGLLWPSPRRVIVVGLDAADWQLLDAYRADGTMPNLARLVSEGRSGVLRAFKPQLSPLLWTTMMTGVSPLRHRVLDFTRFDPQTGAREPITSDERLEKAVWEMAGDQGRDVAVLGMWATHPAEPVRGLMVSDRLFAFYVREQAPAGVVFPAQDQARVFEERKRVEQEVKLAALQAYLPWLTADELARLEAGGNPYAHPVTTLPRILVQTRLYHRLAVDWIRRERPALSVVYFEGTDTIGHVFAAYAPPRQEVIAPADFERYQSVPRTYFREIDGLLGDYRALAAQTGAVLLIVSDHGFLWGEGRPQTSGLAGATAGLWHRDEGIYVLWGRGIEPSATRGEGRVGQVAATILGLLGLPRAAGSEGPALSGVAEVLPAKNYGVRSPRAVAKGGAPADEAIDRLKALGYVGSAESATRPDSAGAEHAHGRVVRQRGHAAEGGREAVGGARRVRAGAAPRPQARRGEVQPRRDSRERGPLPGSRRPAARRARGRPRSGAGAGDRRRGVAPGRRAAGAAAHGRGRGAAAGRRAAAPDAGAHPDRAARVREGVRGLRRRPPCGAAARGRARSRRLGPDVSRTPGRGAPRVRAVAGARPEPAAAARALGSGPLSGCGPRTARPKRKQPKEKG